MYMQELKTARIGREDVQYKYIHESVSESESVSVASACPPIGEISGETLRDEVRWAQSPSIRRAWVRYSFLVISESDQHKTKNPRDKAIKLLIILQYICI
jgi:hypothetical protein